MTARKRGLGRGLDALLGAEPVAPKPSGEGATTRPIDQLVPNRFQPRTYFDDSDLEDLSASIRAQGIVQPLVVTARDDGRYTIVAGERRWRASKKAGLAEVPVFVRDVADDQQLLELALVENLQRADLNAVEEAEAYRSLAERFELSQEEIGTRVGKSRPAIANALRLLRLPQAIQDLLRDGRLSAGQARPLVALGDEALQIALAEEASTQGWSAREVEARAAQRRAQPSNEPKSKAKQELDANTQAALDRLTRHLQTKVEIVRRRRGGLLRIHFHSEDELIRLYEILTKANEGE